MSHHSLIGLMKSLLALPPGMLTVGLLYCLPTAQAHTWVEQLNIIASNGSFVGVPGYPRGFVPRIGGTDPDIGMTYLLPPNGRSTANAILPTDLMCKQSQSVGDQTQGYPPLTAGPGDQIALIYQENGHVSQLFNSPTKPVGSGTVFIYGTMQPSNSDTYLGIHRVWNTAGTGGDQRGRLLATRHFDDGQCFQNDTTPPIPTLETERRKEFNPIGNDLKCQSDVQLPTDAPGSGTYTLYWVWEWPTLDNVTGAVLGNQSYTTCMDINLTPKKFPDVGSFKTDQAVDFRAIEAQLSTPFIVNPTIAEQLTSTAGKAAATLAPSSAAATASPVSHTSAQSSPASEKSTTIPGGNFVTVTVMGSQTVSIVTMTKTVDVANTASPKASTSTNIPIGAGMTIATAPSVSIPLASPSSSPPAVAPFLSSRSQASTLLTFASQASPSINSASANALKDAAVSATRILAPNQSAVTYLNGNLHNRAESIDFASADAIKSADAAEMSAAATSDCPDMTPSTPATTQTTVATRPSQGTYLYPLNLTNPPHYHVGEPPAYKLRGRYFRK